MAEEEQEEEKTFPQEEIEAVVLPILEELLKDKNWDETIIPHWINTICERSVAGLTDLQKPFKWMVTATIQ